MFPNASEFKPLDPIPAIAADSPPTASTLVQALALLLCVLPVYGLRALDEVHRQYYESDTNAWPRAQQLNVHTPPLLSPSLFPQVFSSGVEDWQISRPDWQMLQMDAPQVVLTTQNIPYRFRVTQMIGWCKQNAVAQVRSTSNAAILGQYPNGMAVNQVPVDFLDPILPGDGNFPIHQETVMRTIDDQVQMNGVHQNEVSYPKGTSQIISDSFMTSRWGPDTSHEDELNSVRTFHPKIIKCNFTCNKQLKLIPFTTVDTNPPTTAAEWFSLVNQPGVWTP
eukprot:SAG11_NODE_1569_length_4669_cov_15.982276_4_plen_280_part_00